jgi:hypothetical protein
VVVPLLGARPKVQKMAILHLLALLSSTLTAATTMMWHMPLILGSGLVSFS